MPYTITYTLNIPTFSDPTPTDAVTNPADNSISKEWEIPLFADPTPTETVDNAADNSISKEWEIPLFADPSYAYDITYPRPGGKYASRATQQVLIGMLAQRHIFPLLPRRGYTLQWKFRLADEDDYATPVSGKTGITVQYSRDGDPFVTVSNSVTEIGSGWYSVEIPEEATNVEGTTLILKATVSGCAQCDEIIQFYKGNEYFITFVDTLMTWAEICGLTWEDICTWAWDDLVDYNGVRLPNISQPITTETVEVVP